MKTPTTEPAIRLAQLFRRRLTTVWSDKEFRQFKQLFKSCCFDTLDDLALIEQYYAFERKRGDNGKHRRDLCTLLNNWQGELDRATEWRELHPLKPPPRKIIPLPPIQSDEPPLPLSPEDEERVGKFMVEYGRRKAITAFQKAKKGVVGYFENEQGFI